MKRAISVLMSAALSLSLIGCSAAKTTETTGATADSLFQGGKYTAEAQGMNGPVKVEVEVDSDKIISVKILDHAESPTISDPAIERIPGAIVENQSIAIDTIAGCTITSKAIISAVTTALLEAGANEAEISKVTEKEVGGELITKSADVVIIGSGGAGMSAALEAKRAGADVIVIDKLPFSGGNTILAGSAMNAADSEMQKKQKMAEAQLSTICALLEIPAKNELMQSWQDAVRADIEQYKSEGADYLYDSPALHKLQTYIDGDYVGNPELIDIFGDHALESVHWLSELGAEWNETISAAVGATWTRSHTPLPTFGAKGAAFVLPQKQEYEKLGGEILLEYTAEELVQDETGRIVGVKGTAANGAPFEFSASRGVVIATGGFSANVEMRQKYNKHWANLDETIPTSNGPQATGDGIVMAEKVNANLIGMEWIQMLPTTVKSFSPAIDSTILVNKEGKRFVKEDGRRDEISKATLEQTESKYWRIVDGHTTEDMLNGIAYTGEVIDEMVDNEGVFKADTLEELAKMLDIPADTFVETINEFNTFVENNGEGDPTGRTLFNQKIDKAPYYALVGQTKVHHTMGGIEINGNAQVLDVDGNKIPGLYAAGEVTGGIHGANRLGGNAITDVVTFGRIAGKNVVLE